MKSNEEALRGKNGALKSDKMRGGMKELWNGDKEVRYRVMGRC